MTVNLILQQSRFDFSISLSSLSVSFRHFSLDFSAIYRFVSFSYTHQLQLPSCLLPLHSVPISTSYEIAICFLVHSHTDKAMTTPKASPHSSPLPRRKVPITHHRKKNIKLGISKKQYSMIGLSGAASEKEYIDEYWSSDLKLRTPNERREPSAFTADVMRVANILTLKDDTRPVGGFKFRVFR